LEVETADPCCGSDGETLGAITFTGGSSWNTLVAAEVALPEPPALLAVTTTRSVWPTSLETGA
jgi:hypothetical protein